MSFDEVLFQRSVNMAISVSVLADLVVTASIKFLLAASYQAKSKSRI